MKWKQPRPGFELDCLHFTQCYISCERYKQYSLKLFSTLKKCYLCKFLRWSLMIFITLVFGLLSSSLLLYSQSLGRRVLRPFSDVSCRTREPWHNFEPNPLFNPRGYIAQIPLKWMGTRVKLLLVFLLIIHLWLNLKPLYEKGVSSWCNG